MAVAIESVMYVLIVWQAPYTSPSCEIYPGHPALHHHYHLALYQALEHIFQNNVVNRRMQHRGALSVWDGSPDGVRYRAHYGPSLRNLHIYIHIYILIDNVHWTLFNVQV